MTKDLTVVEQEVSPLVAKAEALVIKSAKDMQESVEMLSQCNKYLDGLKASKKLLTDPLNETLDEIDSRYDPIEKPLKLSVKTLRAKIGEYQTEVVRKQQEDEAKIASRVKEGSGNLSIESAVRKIDALEKPETVVNTNSGTAKFRKDKVLKITDASKVPDEYWVIDEKALLEALKAGTLVAGAEVEIKLLPINYR